jgi:hypothetical protein
MKKFKVIDFRVSLILIILGLISFMFTIEDLKIRTAEIAILFPAFFWGVWQTLSMIVHLFHTQNWHYFNVRLAYTIFSCAVLYYSFTVDIHDYQHIFLLPFMAIFYTCLCGFENKVNNEIKKSEEQN